MSSMPSSSSLSRWRRPKNTTRLTSMWCQSFAASSFYFVKAISSTSIASSFIEERMRMMLEPNSPTLKGMWFRTKYKLMLSIIYMCFFGLLGSFDQVSAKPINCEHAVIRILLVDKKKFEKDQRIRFRGNVSSIVLEAMKGIRVNWPDIEKVPSKHKLLQSDAAALHLKVHVEKKTKRIAIRKDAQPRRQQRYIHVVKQKKVLLGDKKIRAERVRPTDSDGGSSETEPLQKYPRRAAAEAPSIARTLDFDEPQQEPQTEASSTHSHYSAHTTATSSSSADKPSYHRDKLASILIKLISVHFFHLLHLQLNPHLYLQLTFLPNLLNHLAKDSQR